MDVVMARGKQNGQTLEEAHSVAPSSLNFTADGGRIVSVDMSLTARGYDVKATLRR
jgi:hypothetical protein